MELFAIYNSSDGIQWNRKITKKKMMKYFKMFEKKLRLEPINGNEWRNLL